MRSLLDHIREVSRTVNHSKDRKEGTDVKDGLTPRHNHFSVLKVDSMKNTNSEVEW
jgi:hypothetical protein